MVEGGNNMKTKVTAKEGNKNNKADMKDKSTKMVLVKKLIEKGKKSGALTYKEITERIINDFKQNKYKILYDDANYISNKCLNNYDLVKMELEKIYLYYNKPTEVKRNDLENIISKYMDDNNVM